MQSITFLRLDVSSESSARQRMKNQALFSSKDKSKKSKCRLLQFLFGALKVNIWDIMHWLYGRHLHFGAPLTRHSETRTSDGANAKVDPLALIGDRLIIKKF